jgi:serine/threonine protein kinase
LVFQLTARGSEDPAPASLLNSDSVDLLKKLLKLFAHERITAEEALKHPLFAS